MAVPLATQWLEDYGRMARRHRDADGRMPQHTWSCAYLEDAPLRVIARSVFEGLGEMEIHIHHGTANDDAQDNTAQMDVAIRYFLDRLGQHGACLTAEPKPRRLFAFIQGMWALDNSRVVGNHRQYCGVNREIDLLLQHGCYADFTFPAWGTMTPLWVNRLYVSRDTPKPKSYDDPAANRQLIAGNPTQFSNELSILEGPGYISTTSNIDESQPPSLERMQE